VNTEAVSTTSPDQPATLEVAAQTIATLFAQHSMPGELAEAIRQAYVRLGGGDLPVAVRSSATAEDLPDLSFAGQQETYLNMHGEAMVLDAVKRCWASLWTARAIGYRGSRAGHPGSGWLRQRDDAPVHRRLAARQRRAGHSRDTRGRSSGTASGLTGACCWSLSCWIWSIVSSPITQRHCKGLAGKSVRKNVMTPSLAHLQLFSDTSACNYRCGLVAAYDSMDVRHQQIKTKCIYLRRWCLWQYDCEDHGQDHDTCRY